MSEGKQGIPVGMKFPSAYGRTITEGDFTRFVGQMWYLGDIHSDKEFMKTTEFGERIFPGIGTLGVAFGLESTSGRHEEMAQRGYRAVGLLGLENVRFLRPVHPGDTLKTETEIVDARPSTSRSGSFVMRRMIRCFKQGGVLVMEALAINLVEPIARH